MAIAAGMNPHTWILPAAGIAASQQPVNQHELSKKRGL
jgi:hypothetical protein